MSRGRRFDFPSRHCQAGEVNVIHSSYAHKTQSRPAILPRLRRLLQFSLRGMLLLTAAVALLTMPLLRLHEQQLAVVQLEKRGCALTSKAVRGPYGWAAMRLFGGNAALHVTEVVWQRNDRSRDDNEPPNLAPFGPLKWAEKIDMAWMPVDDEGAGYLGGLSRLTMLKLNGTTITDEGLGCLGKCRQLKRLELHRAPITDAGLNHLTGLMALENLDLSSTQITGNNLEPLLHLPALEVLNLNGTPLTDDAVPVLSRLKRLLWLGVSDTRLSEDACDALAAALPKTAIDD
ncbi:MAG TPA: hypothetical protein VF278_07415 [Pirellulales bacterium]